MPDTRHSRGLPDRPEGIVFHPGSFVRAGDGTEVSAFLNPYDAQSGSAAHPAGQAMSMAAGRVGPGVRSTIHVHPALTQITYVTAGTLTVLTRAPDESGPSRFQVPAGAATVTEAGALLQLCNEEDQPVEVLYVTCPAYILETAADGSIRYEDALMLGEDWEAPGVCGWDTEAAAEARRRATSQRAAAAGRMAARAGR